MGEDIFRMIMEADDDLEAFDDSAPAADEAPPADDTGGGDDTIPDDGPPEPNDDGGDDLGSLDDFGSDSSTGAGDEGGDNGEEDAKEDESLSEKANSILNQKLYKQLVDRNKEIEDVLNNYQSIVPVLPYETVKENDVPVTRLKAALSKGQSYSVNNFVESKYGENLVFYRKLDTLYKILCDQIDIALKKFKRDE